MRALSPQPDHRFATADDMRLALEQLAGKLGARSSTSALADYMKRVFAGRTLHQDDEPELEYSIDFDGPGCGVVQAPEDALRNFAIPGHMVPTASAPISRARTKAITNQPPLSGVPTTRSTGDTRPIGSKSSAPARAISDGLEIIVVTDPPRSRRKLFMIGGAAGAVVVIAIAIIAVRGSRTAPIPTAALEMIKPPPQLAPPVVRPPPPAAVEVKAPEPEVPAADPKSAKKQHHRSTPKTDLKPSEASKKHWDPKSLFPK
jgi:hypothetical protein